MKQHYSLLLLLASASFYQTQCSQMSVTFANPQVKLFPPQLGWDTLPAPDSTPALVPTGQSQEFEEAQKGSLLHQVLLGTDNQTQSSDASTKSAADEAAQKQQKLDQELIEIVESRERALMIPYRADYENIKEDVLQISFARLTKALEAGANPNVRGNKGKYPVLLTALYPNNVCDDRNEKNALQILHLFFNTGKLDVNKRSITGASALSFAKEKNLVHLAAILEVMGAKEEESENKISQ